MTFLAGWPPLLIGAFAAGLWLALRRLGRLPTVRVLLVLLACWGVAHSYAGTWLRSAGHWLMALVSSHLGPWAVYVQAGMICALAFLGLVIIISVVSRSAPDRIAEFGCITAAVLLLLVGGAFTPAGGI